MLNYKKAFRDILMNSILSYARDRFKKGTGADLFDDRTIYYEQFEKIMTRIVYFANDFNRIIDDCIEEAKMLTSDKSQRLVKQK